MESTWSKSGMFNKNLFIFSFTVFFVGCEILNTAKELPGTIGNTANQASNVIEDAVTKLTEQSADWQVTLKELEDKLRRDGESLIANEVTQLAQKGIATGGTELRCNADFVRTRMSQDLQRIVARLTKKPIPPVIPALCQVVPDHVDMGHRSNLLTFHGYDLNPNLNIVLKYDGGEESLNQFKSHPTHYLMALDLTAPNLCGKYNRKIILRNGSEDLSSIIVIKKDCPEPAPAPSRDPERDHFIPIDYNEFCGLTCGIGKDVEFGGLCAPGYERSRFLVTKLGGTGRCSGDESPHLGWVDPGDPNNCRIRVHFGANWNQGIHCKIEVKEIGKEKPIPPTPDCGCW